MDKKLFLILGNHLFPLKHFKNFQDHHFLLIEDSGLCTHFKYHKHKILLFLLSMRNFYDKLKKNKFSISYIDLNDKTVHLTFEEKLKDFIKKQKITQITMFEIEDIFFEERLVQFFTKQKINFHFLPNPMFLTSREDFKEYLSQTKKPLLLNFYQRQRKKLNILMDKNQQPVGGKWSFDQENRKKLPAKINFPPLPTINLSSHENFSPLKKIIEKYFPQHYGSCENFWAPTTREEAIKFLSSFLNEKLKHFGTYQDSITTRHDFLFHSLLSPALNLGLLTPDEVVKKTLEHAATHKIPLNNTEGFIRQIVGWREFVRGIYQNYHGPMEENNFWQHQRQMTTDWYQGTLGIPPVDDAIKKTLRLSYAHHIERLMILSNFMLLCEIHPHAVYQWFMELYLDSSDWVMAANVFGMGQFSDGGIFATKPYISGSNYILKMSDYKKGEWSDVWDGLYWRFIDKHQQFYLKNPRMSMMVNLLQKMDKSKKNKLFKKAENFLQEFTKQKK